MDEITAYDYGSMGIHPVGAQIIPITQEPIMFNPEDANAVSRFFQSIADKVVLATTLAKEVEELRQVVDQLKRDVESYRENSARLDEEVSRLRSERQALQDENASLRAERDTEVRNHTNTQVFLTNACSERDRWHSDFIQASTVLEDVKRERDDAQVRVMELEDRIRGLENGIAHWQAEANEANNRLGSIRSALAA